MPVIRISHETWARLKAHATPLEDTANDIVNIALDALDLAQREGLQIPRAMPKEQSDRTKFRNRLSLKQFQVPLLETLYALGGSAYSREIRAAMEPLIAPMLSGAAYEILPNGQPRWWNAICSVRNHFISKGLFRPDSERGVWDLSARGIEFMKARTDNTAGKRQAGRPEFKRKQVRARRKDSLSRRPGS